MNLTTVAPFSAYQRVVLLGLGGLLFTVVLDFILLPALSSTLLNDLLTTSQFGWVLLPTHLVPRYRHWSLRVLLIALIVRSTCHSSTGAF